MTDLPKLYLTKEQAISRFPFLTGNMLKNLLFKDINGFRTKVVRKLGKRILLDEEAFLKYISENKGQFEAPSEEIGSEINLDSFLEEMSRKLPNLVCDKDLEATGLFSVTGLSNARKKGKSPPFLKINRKYVYLKQDVLLWIRKFYVNNSK